MPKLIPHIAFNGNTEEAFTFYKSVFGGEFTKIIRFKDLPENPDFPIPEEEGEKFMNLALSIDGDTVLTGNDVPSILGTVNEKENRSKITVSTANKDEAQKFFSGLSVGGEIEVPFELSPDGPGFGMFRDKYGIEWMINFEPGKAK